ncbi:MAG TPA: phosphoribosyl-ATP diphosphatase [Spirochaetia bacterium]|nr:phosphoribosyl-ATP diphosphatase [Spirochaetia bacterium]
MVDQQNDELARRLPLVITDTEGGFVDLAVTSEKAFRKSFEHGTLWCVNAETGRVLPYESVTFGREPVFSHIEKREGYVHAAVPRPGATGSESAAQGPGNMAGSPAPTGEHAAPPGHDVITHLVDTIRERHSSMPEGSYTTYLFREGGSKIRKKTGEEAVEVILSADTDELVRESADLIYHLLVLLESESVSFHRVLGELDRRSR